MNVTLPSFALALLLLTPLAGLHAADQGRGGKGFRQSWNPGAYCRVTWETTSAKPVAKLLLDVSTYPPGFKPPQIAYSIDGVWKSNVACTREIAIDEITGAGSHELEVILQSSEQRDRWGSAGQNALNVLRIAGLQVNADSKPVPAAPATPSKWALMIGDSITEGIGGSELAGYSHLLGKALQTQGY